MKGRRIMKTIVMRGLIILLGFCSTGASAGLITGSIINSPEFVPPLVLGDGTNHVTLRWSLNTSQKGWFLGSNYGVVHDTDIAYAAGVASVDQIVNAASYSYTSSFLGPIGTWGYNGGSGFLLLKNINTNHYAAVQLMSINVQAGYGYLGANWWFLDDGSSNFSVAGSGGTSVPEPPAYMLALLGLAGLMAGRGTPLSIVKFPQNSL